MQNYVLIDSLHVWKDLLPLTFTRSVADCRVGIQTILEKWQTYLKAEVQVQYAMDYLREKALPLEQSICILSHILPTPPVARCIEELRLGEWISFEGECIAWNGSKNKEIVWRDSISKIANPWDLFLLNDQEVRNDYNILTSGRTSIHLSSDNQVLGDEIFLEEGAKVHCAILNSTTGPIYIGKNAEVMEGSMIRGSFALGENAQIKMGTKIYGATTVGRGCKVGGEITNSIFFANSNKAHDGYLGNSIIAEWCNLGADTNSSNLKNNYSPVEIYNYSQGKLVETGQQFLGLIMGDHSKCGINTMFNTGTVVGVCANIVGAGFPKKHIPSFSWAISDKIRPYDLEKAFETIHVVYKRRGRTLSNREERILRHLHGEMIRSNVSLT